jgi:hypothetical protein
MKRLAMAAAGLTALAVLAGCGGVPKDRGICPRVAILNDAGKLTRFRPGAPETAENVVFTAEMREIKITCKYNDQLMQQLEADVFVTMILRKGPAMSGDVAELPYFVSVTDRRGTVLEKREFPLRINFSGNAAVEHTEKSWQYYRLRRGYSGIEYETWVGFQLDDRQLEFNRRSATR